MSAFSEAFSRGLDRLYSKMGEAAKITRLDCSEVDCSLLPVMSLESYGSAVAELTADSVVFSVRTSEVGDHLRRGELVELLDSSTEYVVDRMIESNEHELTFAAA